MLCFDFLGSLVDLIGSSNPFDENVGSCAIRDILCDRLVHTYIYCTLRHEES
jgi:hypothetical protein